MLSSGSMESGTIISLPLAPSYSSNPVKMLYIEGRINQKANEIIFIVGPDIFCILTMLAEKFRICDPQTLIKEKASLWKTVFFIPWKLECFELHILL